MKKLRDLLSENVLGELPSARLFKYNKATGKYDAPGNHPTNEECDDEIDETLSNGSKKMMQGNVNIKDISQLKSAVNGIFADLTDDGFDSSDVLEFINLYINSIAKGY